MESATASKKKRLSPSSMSQIQILNALVSNASATPEPRRLQINEIAELSGLRDEKETQRFLFILEGQKLVTPLPPGDFTSKTWQITKDGIRALNMISRSAMQ